MSEDVVVDQFYENEATQTRYGTRVRALRAWLKERYPEDYTDVVQLETVRGIARSEIQVQKLERMVGNNKEGAQTNMLLLRERGNLRSLRDALRMDIKQLQKDEIQVEHILTTDFRDHVRKQLESLPEQKREDESGTDAD